MTTKAKTVLICDACGEHCAHYYPNTRNEGKYTFIPECNRCFMRFCLSCSQKNLVYCCSECEQYYCIHCYDKFSSIQYKDECRTHLFDEITVSSSYESEEEEEEISTQQEFNQVFIKLDNIMKRDDFNTSNMVRLKRLIDDYDTFLKSRPSSKRQKL